MDYRLVLYKKTGNIEEEVKIGGEPITLSSYTYNAKRMGAAPFIEGSILHPLCLDSYFEDSFVKFKGENFYIKHIPSSSKSNTDARYKHDVVFISERAVLDNIYFMDVVSDNDSDYKPVTNNSDFVFDGSLKDIVYRLNMAFKSIGVDYAVVIDEGIETENKTISFSNLFISQVLTELYNQYEVPFYFDSNKVIHFGNNENEINEVFSYGVDNALLSINKINTGEKVINRITGFGSSDNIPYYYPNKTEKGDVTFVLNKAQGSMLAIELEDIKKFAKNVKTDATIEYNYFSGIEYVPNGNYVINAEGYITENKQNLDIPLSEFHDSVLETNEDFYYFRLSHHIKFKVYFKSTNATIYKPSEGVTVYLNGSIEHVPPSASMVTIYRVASDGTEYYLDATAIAEDSNQVEIYLERSQEGECYKMTIGYQFQIRKSSISKALNKYSVRCWCNLGSAKRMWFDRDKGEEIKLEDIGLALKEGTSPSFGDKIMQRVTRYVKPQPYLMPKIYFDSDGEERFYNAISNVYDDPKNEGDKLIFENEYSDRKRSEHILELSDIKPTIKGAIHNNLRIDMFEEFAYDESDNNEVDEDGNLIHPFFFGKLRPLGFNLFEHTIEKGQMTISLTSGHCSGCSFVIKVTEEGQENVVQVYGENNELLRDENGDVVCNRKEEKKAAQKIQNDTTSNYVWIALEKDKNTFGENAIMPSGNIKPSAVTASGNNDGDTFVILHIDLPDEYIRNAEEKLTQELISHMYENNLEKFNFSIKLSRIYMMQNEDILSNLNENSLVHVKYNGFEYVFYVGSYSFKVANNELIPEVNIELSNTVTVRENSIKAIAKALNVEMQKADDKVINKINSLQQSLPFYTSNGTSFFNSEYVDFSGDVEIQGDSKVNGFLYVGKSLDVADEVEAKKVHAGEKVVVGAYSTGASGAIIEDRADGTYMEIDKLKVRTKAYFEQLVIQETDTIGGKQIISPAGAIECVSVLTKYELEERGVEFEEGVGDFYRCFFRVQDDDSSISNLFMVGDQAYSKSFNIKGKGGEQVTNKYYWRLVVGVGDNYIDLSYDKRDTASDDIPSAGDIICHLGHQDENKKERQNAMIFSSIDEYSPSIILYHGINDFSLTGKEVVAMGVDGNGDAFFKVGANHSEEYMKYTQSGGLEISGKLVVGTTLEGEDLKELINSASPDGYQEFVESVTGDISEIKVNVNGIEGSIGELQKQLDGAIETWFYEGIPTLNNKPAVDWDSEDLKNNHLGDLYYNKTTGKAYRFQMDDTDYVWVEITDTDIQAAMEAANNAQDTADKKRRVFIITPYAPYDEGDLWVQGENGDILRCVKSNAECFDTEDWELASKYTDDTKANEAIEKISGYEYLKTALNENTVINKGLILSSLIQLRNDNKIMSGVNGTTPSGGSSIAFWAGGDMIDKGIEGNETKEGAATFIVRMDGSGYFSDGKISWDKNGNLYFADDIKVGDSSTLASIISGITKLTTTVEEQGTEIDINAQNITKNVEAIKAVKELFDKLFTLESLEDGSNVIRANYTLYSVGGISALGEGVDGGAGGASTLGRLLNVNDDVDDIPTDDVVLIRESGDTHWAKKRLSDILGEHVSSDKNYVHYQDAPSDSWRITHNMNKYPSVSIVDSGGSVVFGEVVYNSLSSLTLNFNGGFSGKAILN